MCLLQPSQFEQCLVQMLQSLKEPLEVKPGEINVSAVEFFITPLMEGFKHIDLYTWSL